MIPSTVPALVGPRSKVEIIMLPPPIVEERIAPNPVRPAQDLRYGAGRLVVQSLAQHAQQGVQVAAEPRASRALAPFKTPVLSAELFSGDSGEGCRGIAALAASSGGGLYRGRR